MSLEGNSETQSRSVPLNIPTTFMVNLSDLDHLRANPLGSEILDALSLKKKRIEIFSPSVEHSIETTLGVIFEIEDIADGVPPVQISNEVRDVTAVATGRFDALPYDFTSPLDFSLALTMIREQKPQLVIDTKPILRCDSASEAERVMTFNELELVREISLTHSMSRLIETGDTTMILKGADGTEQQTRIGALFEILDLSLMRDANEIASPEAFDTAIFLTHTCPTDFGAAIAVVREQNPISVIKGNVGFDPGI